MRTMPQAQNTAYQTGKRDQENVPKGLEGTFQCDFLGKVVTLNDCIDNYTHHTAKMKRDSPCCKCKTGAKKRDDYANS